IRRLSGQHLTPIIDDNGKVTHETWDIANYPEARFPDRPSLFGGAAGKGMTRSINRWSDMWLGPPLRRVIYADLPAVPDPDDRAYFRSSRERDLGMSLEEACADPESKPTAFQQACAQSSALLNGRRCDGMATSSRHKDDHHPTSGIV